jgi:hypothetical protein
VVIAFDAVLFLDNAVDDRIDPSVFPSPLRGVVVGDAPGIAISLGGEAGPLDPEGINQVVHHAFGTPQGKPHVVAVAAHIVGVPLDDSGGRGVFLHEVTDPGDFTLVLRSDVGLARVEFYLERHAEPLGEDTGRKRLHVDGAINNGLDPAVLFLALDGSVVGNGTG